MIYRSVSVRRTTAFIAMALLAVSHQVALGQPSGPIRIDASRLPARSFPEGVAERPVPAWLRTNLRIGHLPPGFGRMPQV